MIQSLHGLKEWLDIGVEDKITDLEFIEALEFLIESGIIKVADPRVLELEKENSELRQKIELFEYKDQEVVVTPVVVTPVVVTPVVVTPVVVTTVAGSGSPGCEEVEGCFIPSTATVDVGGKVIFSNTDSAAHTFTSGEATDVESVGAVFDSSLAMAGGSFEWSPTEAGDVPYFCLIHPWMIGNITVN